MFATINRHEVIMLQKLSITLLSSAPKITYYAFEKIPIILKIMPLILANNVMFQPFSSFNWLLYQSILPAVLE